MKECLKWNDSRAGLWNTNSFTWEEVCIIIEIQQIGGAGDFDHLYGTLNSQSKDKRRKIIKIVAKLEGKEFEQSKKKNPNVKISVKDVEILVDKLNINVNVQDLT